MPAASLPLREQAMCFINFRTLRRHPPDDVVLGPTFLRENATSYRFKLGLLSTVSLAALAAGGMSAWGAETVGNGSMTGTIAGDLVVASGGSCTLYQANVSGNVQVLQNASLTVDGLEEWSSIGGNIQAVGCASARLEGSVTVGGSVQIENCTGARGFAGPGIKIYGSFQCLNSHGACEATLGPSRRQHADPQQQFDNGRRCQP
jgi:hypothetical protein